MTGSELGEIKQSARQKNFRHVDAWKVEGDCTKNVAGAAHRIEQKGPEWTPYLENSVTASGLVSDLELTLDLSGGAKEKKKTRGAKVRERNRSGCDKGGQDEEKLLHFAPQSRVSGTSRGGKRKGGTNRSSTGT